MRQSKVQDSKEQFGVLIYVKYFCILDVILVPMQFRFHYYPGVTWKRGQSKTSTPFLTDIL